MDITWKGAHTNNFQNGRSGNLVSKVVIHWIVGTLESADATFQNPQRIASAHYGIGDGDIHQYVKEEDTAYHAGNLTVNRQSIGIEHEGGPSIPVTDATYQTSGELIREIAKRYNIPLDRQHIIKHSEVKATQCPGTIDLDRLISIAKQGGNMPNMYKGLDLSNAESMKIAVDAWADLRDGKLVKAVDADAKAASEYERGKNDGKSEGYQEGYAKGFEEGKASVPTTTPTVPPTSVDESEWRANGMSIKTTEGNVEKTINYERF